MTRIAVLQMTSGIDPATNLATIATAARKAATGGATMLFTPEMCLALDRDRARLSAKLGGPSEDGWIVRLADIAREQGLWLAVGSIPVALPDAKFANRSLLFDGEGRLRQTYDKIHMFDVDLAEGESWRESNGYAAGSRMAVAEETPAGRLGLAVCYDIRFPALFDALGRARCDCISIPAAFTVPTGRAHWHTLVRARAIEASAYVVAAAQVGRHEDGRETYGHSLVVDPWGKLLLDLGGSGTELGFADIEAERIAEARRQLPSLANRRAIAT
jgi:predicted amidohydrolase